MWKTWASMGLASSRVLESISVDSRDELLISFVQVIPYNKFRRNIEMKLSTIQVYFSQILGVEGMQGLGTNSSLQSAVHLLILSYLLLIFPRLTHHCALRIKACQGASL